MFEHQSTVDHAPRFRFILEDISFASDEALRARAMTALARLVLWCFRHARNPDELLARFMTWSAVVDEVARTPNGAAALALVVRYILSIIDRPPEEVLPQLLAAVSPTAREAIVSTADILEQRGLIKGQRSALLKLLAIRFGELPEPVVRKVQEADAALLEGWLERVVTVATLHDVPGEA